MRYEIDGNDLCIRIPIDAIVELAKEASVVNKIIDAQKLALALGRELCECENISGNFYINSTLDEALERVIESDDSSIQYKDEQNEI